MQGPLAAYHIQAAKSKAVFFLLASSAAVLLYCVHELVLRLASCFQSILHSISTFAAGAHKGTCYKSLSAPKQLLLYLLSYSKLFLMSVKGLCCKCRNITCCLLRTYASYSFLGISELRILVNV